MMEFFERILTDNYRPGLFAIVLVASCGPQKVAASPVIAVRRGVHLELSVNDEEAAVELTDDNGASIPGATVRLELLAPSPPSNALTVLAGDSKRTTVVLPRNLRAHGLVATYLGSALYSTAYSSARYQSAMAKPSKPTTLYPREDPSPRPYGWLVFGWLSTGAAIYLMGRRAGTKRQKPPRDDLPDTADPTTTRLDCPASSRPRHSTRPAPRENGVLKVMDSDLQTPLIRLEIKICDATSRLGYSAWTNENGDLDLDPISRPTSLTARNYLPVELDPSLPSTFAINLTGRRRSLWLIRSKANQALRARHSEPDNQSRLALQQAYQQLQSELVRLERAIFGRCPKNYDSEFAFKTQLESLLERIEVIERRTIATP